MFSSSQRVLGVRDAQVRRGLQGRQRQLVLQVAQDPLTKKWRQVTRRGFASALEASQARRDVLESDVPVSVDMVVMADPEGNEFCVLRSLAQKEKERLLPKN